MAIKLPPALLNIHRYTGVYPRDIRIKFNKNNLLSTPPYLQEDSKGTCKRDYDRSGEAVRLHGFFY